MCCAREDAVRIMCEETGDTKTHRKIKGRPMMNPKVQMMARITCDLCSGLSQSIVRSAFSRAPTLGPSELSQGIVCKMVVLADTYST